MRSVRSGAVRRYSSGYALPAPLGMGTLRTSAMQRSAKLTTHRPVHRGGREGQRKETHGDNWHASLLSPFCLPIMPIGRLAAGILGPSGPHTDDMILSLSKKIAIQPEASGCLPRAVNRPLH